MSCRFRSIAVPVLCAAAVFLASRNVPAQQVIFGKPGVATGRISLPFRALADYQQMRHEVITPHPIPEPQPRPSLGRFGMGGDPVRGDIHAEGEAPPPAGGDHDEDSPNLGISFGGYAQNNGWIPPDTMGAVGPNDIVEILNNGVTITSRSGVVQTGLKGLRTSSPLTPPIRRLSIHGFSTTRPPVAGSPSPMR